MDREELEFTFVYLIVIFLSAMFGALVVNTYNQYAFQSQWNLIPPVKQIINYEKDIEYNETAIVINTNNLQREIFHIRFAPSKSMQPLINNDTTAFVFYVKNESDLNIGDIVGYYPNMNNRTKRIAHRIAAIDKDENGTYYILKGDNNMGFDEEKVRYEQIVYKIFMLVY